MAESKFIGPSFPFYVYIVCITMTFVFHKYGHSFLMQRFDRDPFFKHFVEYNSPSILFSGVALLLLFSRLNITRFKSFIHLASQLAFSVYLIQNQTHIWEHLLKGAFKWVADFPIWLLPPVLLFIPLAIYIVCSLIDYLRLCLFRIIRLA